MNKVDQFHQKMEKLRLLMKGVQVPNNIQKLDLIQPC